MKLNKVILVIVIVIILIILGSWIFTGNSNYKKTSHIKDVEKSKSNNDTDDYKTVGWIDIYGTSINMPIFTYKSAFRETVKLKNFSWMDGKDKMKNFIPIYGHNIMNLGIPQRRSKDFERFDELMDYVYEDFAKDYKFFQVTIGGRDYIYKIFSVSLLDNYNIQMFPDDGASKKEMKSIIKLLKNESIYKYSVDVGENDDIIVLNTCTRIFGTGARRGMVVAGRKLHDMESKKDYFMRKTKKYEEISKVLRGA